MYYSICLPSVNIIQYLLCFPCRVCVKQIFHNPINQMVLKSPLDQLVKDIWCNEPMDICSGKQRCEWLDGNGQIHQTLLDLIVLTRRSPRIPNISHSSRRVYAFRSSSVCSWQRWRAGLSRLFASARQLVHSYWTLSRHAIIFNIPRTPSLHNACQ